MRILSVLPSLAAAGLLTSGHMAGFAHPASRLLSVALALGLLPLVVFLARRQAVSRIEMGMVAFMAASALALGLAPRWAAPLWSRFGISLLYLALALAVALPRWWGRGQFTEYFAKRRAPRQFWQSQAFAEINRLMSRAWFVLLALCSLLAALPGLFAWGLALRLVFQVGLPLLLLLGLGLPFNRLYPDYHLHRHGLAPGADPGAGGSCRQLIASMPLGFRPRAAGDLAATIQFEVNGPEVFSSHLVIAHGRCTHHPGPAERPDLVIRTPAQVWLQVATGKLDGQQALMAGQYQAQGDLSLLVRLGNLFGRAGSAAAGE